MNLKKVIKDGANQYLKPKEERIQYTEFEIYTSDFDDIMKALKPANIQQILPWQDKYYPTNPFGDEIAKFSLFDLVRLFFVRNEEKTEYTFLINEPESYIAEHQVAKKIEVLLSKSKLKFTVEKYFFDDDDKSVEGEFLNKKM